jgi:response regulator RpfG family c-di-GMP phosphodiesterase
MTERTVLAVDDEPEIVESLARALRGESYGFIGTTSPERARELLDGGRIDLLIADIDMPGINGLELVAHVRRTRPAVVRILLTGDASLESAMDAINRGEVHRYFTKPWRNEALRRSIRDALARADELRRRADAGASVEARERLLDALDRAYPGIRAVRLVDGAYELDIARLRGVLTLLSAPGLERLLAGSSPPAAPQDIVTSRKGRTAAREGGA